MRTNYIILFQGRVGSSYLVDALSRLPGVVAEGEMLVDVDPGRWSSWRNRLRKFVFAEPEPATPRLQLDSSRRFYAAPWEGARAAGFKTKVRDVCDLEGFAAVLDTFAVRAIVLERRNLVKQAVSNLNADRLYAARGEWNLQVGQSGLGPFNADPEAFDAALRRVVFEQEMLLAFVRYVRVPVLRLDYEGLLRDRTGWFGSVCRFIGIEPAEPRSEVVKNTRDELRDVLLNYDELRLRYAGTPFAVMFDGSGSHDRAP